MDDLSKRLRLGDPAALEEVIDRYIVRILTKLFLCLIINVQSCLKESNSALCNNDKKEFVS